MSEAILAARPLGARFGTLAVFLACGSGIGAWAASIALVKQGLDLSDATLGIALFAFASGSILVMPGTGWLVTRFGSARLMTGAGLTFGIALLLPALAASFPALVASTFVLGICNGLLDVSMNAYATGVQRAWGSPIMSSFHAAFSLGGLLGSAGMGLLLTQGVGVRAGLALTSIGVAGLIVIAAALVRDGAEFGQASDEAPHGFAWPSRALIGLGFLCFLTMLVEGALADWSGVYLATVVGASAAAAASGYAAFSVMMAAGRLLGDPIVHAFDGVVVLRFGAGLGAIGLVLALGVTPPAAVVCGLALVGLGLANVVPLLFSAAGRTRNASAGAGIAAAATLGYAGFLLGPPLIGFAADLIGLRFALAILPVAAAIVSASVGRVMRP